MGQRRNSYKVLVGNTEGKTPFVCPRLRSEDNIKINFKEIEYDIVTEFMWLKIESSGGLL
jgi:hypothetical protein